jgi:predicted amidohydrolase YtcJ
MDALLLNGLLYRGRRAGKGALAIRGGRIARIAGDREIWALRGPGTEVFDLAGGLVLPAFRDAHLHSPFGSFLRRDIDLSGLFREEDYLERVSAYAAAHPGEACLFGWGWSYCAFGPKGPGRAALDSVVGDRPVFLTAIDGHAAWLNSRAIRMSGIRPSPGCLVEADESGEPTGTLREISAQLRALEALPPPDPGRLASEARAFERLLFSKGIVAVHDAMLLPEVAAAYAEARLDLRVGGAFLREPGRAFADLRGRFAGARFRPASAKLFLDGIAESRTACLLEPYADRPGFRGASPWEEGELLRAVCELDKAGFQIHAHAMGDAAVRLALDAFERAAGENGRRDGRHLIAHAELVSEGDVPRFRELGVVAVMQPAWFYLDEHSDASLVERLGPGRTRSRFRMRSLIEAGAAVACGSDYPAGGDLVILDPLEAVGVGATRRALGSGEGPAYMPDELVGVEDLVDAYTLGSAYAAFDERETGSIEEGKSADLAVLDRNILEMPAHEIHGARVVLTFAAGKAVFRAAG